MSAHHARRNIYASSALVAALLAAAPAQAAIFIYTGTFSGANENPANASPATGNAIVTIDNVLNTIRVQANFSGLMSNTNNGHIHCCSVPGVNSGVAFGLPTFLLGVTSGAYDVTTSNFTPSATLLNGLNNGLAYVNIHTTGLPGGEIRANLTAVPEPAVWLSMVFGFGLLGAVLRKPVVRTRVRYS